jgi:plasmid stabilization system protein ParE
MAARLIIAPDVEQDIAETYGWYEERQAGLGEEFLTCVDACIQKIVRRPQAYPKAYLQYRRALVRRFPYLVFYEYVGDTVTVFGVFHASRHPGKWRQRLPL